MLSRPTLGTICSVLGDDPYCRTIHTTIGTFVYDRNISILYGTDVLIDCGRNIPLIYKYGVLVRSCHISFAAYSDHHLVYSTVVITSYEKLNTGMAVPSQGHAVHLNRLHPITLTASNE